MPEHPIHLTYTHRIVFGRKVFAPGSSVINDLLSKERGKRVPKVLVFVDDRVETSNPNLAAEIRDYAKAHPDVLKLAGDILTVPGGEDCKNDFGIVNWCWEQINEAALDRHSYVFVIGGGAVLDLVCFAASTAHRGIRHVRFPTTTLSQGDGGVGVKNGVNFQGKKNWIGTFAVPFAVINDFAFLDTLPERERRHGIIEAVKVGLIRDKVFFEEIESMAEDLAALKPSALERVVTRSAELHVEHIATNGDPFELGSARPLDFGHWAAHKLEQVSGFKIAHGEAVAIGMALDLVYSARIGLIERATARRIVELIEKLGFATYAPYLMRRAENGDKVILQGLEEFREHLGGELTITLVPDIGTKVEVHEMDQDHILGALDDLRIRGKTWTES
ncbi:MAG: 3-dehydroquinate synthase [Verrucomicrobiaceae bacterium]|nr:3-dehydroquinate synthase [Verrucomicrobiaceae bacterium]